MKNSIHIFLIFLCSSAALFAQRNQSNNDSHFFEENKGQLVDMNGEHVPNVLFKVNSSGVNVFVTEKGLTYLFQRYEYTEEMDSVTQMKGHRTKVKAVHWERVDLELVNAAISANNTLKEEESEHGTLNYFLAHCPNGIRNVKKYGKLTIRNIYPNIDWVLYNTSNNGFKYDFVLHSGANLDDIRMVYSLKEKLEMIDGKLLIHTSLGAIKEDAPVSFLNKKRISSAFHLESVKENELGGFNNVITFVLDENALERLQNASENNQLVIDPELEWGTFFGGSGGEASSSIKADSQGNLFVAGYSSSLDFPVMSASGYYQGTASTPTDVTISKFSASDALLWSTYYGGSNYEYLYGFEIDDDDNLYCSGITASYNFPTQDAGTYFDPFSNGQEDAFFIKFNSQGDRLWSTFFGGGDTDEIRSLAVKNGVLYAVGYTESIDFPTLASFGNYNQPNIHGILDATITKFDTDGNLLWSTYYGGDGFEQANATAIDSEGNVYIAGNSHSTNLGTQDAGAYFSGSFSGEIDVMILKFDANDNRLWATYHGGDQKEMGNDLAIDHNDNVFLYGYTQSGDFPVLDAGTFFQGVHTDLPSGTGSAMNAIPFLSKFTPQGNLVWSTYYGNQHSYNWQDQHNIALDECGYLYCSTIDAGGIEDIIPFVDGGFEGSWHGQSTRLSLFSNDGDLMGATPLCTMSGHGKYLVCTGTNGTVWTSTAINGFYPQNPLDYSTLPLKNSGSGYYDGTNDIPDDIFINRFKTNIGSDCKIIETVVGNVVIPNVFTPNGDQLNDFYSLTAPNAENIELIIVNRWGNVVFEASGVEPKWDGTDLSGEKVVDGVYYLSYTISYAESETITGQSFVHLFHGK